MTGDSRVDARDSVGEQTLHGQTLCPVLVAEHFGGVETLQGSDTEGEEDHEQVDRGDTRARSRIAFVADRGEEDGDQGEPSDTTHQGEEHELKVVASVSI